MCGTLDQRELLIVGASARAAAQSAMAAGYRVTTIDLFGDADLRQIVDAHVTTRWPADVPGLAAALSARNWMYAGALENHPNVIAEVSSQHALIGCDEQTVRSIRDPVALCKTVTRAGFCMPETLHDVAGEIAFVSKGRGDWLRKPLRSAGGQGIHRLRQRHQINRPQDVDGEPCVLQKEVAGSPHGAVFVASDHECRLWGATKQLIALSEFGASGFQYCGSIGPVQLSLAVEERLYQLGKFLAERFQLRGLFGIDFVIAHDTPWLIEVNPRYTASAEVLERATGLSAVQLHRAACNATHRTSDNLIDVRGSKETITVVGKAILFAREKLVVPKSASDELLGHAERRLVADVPHACTAIAPGHPMFTVFAGAQTMLECTEALSQHATEWYTNARGWRSTVSSDGSGN